MVNTPEPDICRTEMFVGGSPVAAGPCRNHARDQAMRHDGVVARAMTAVAARGEVKVISGTLTVDAVLAAGAWLRVRLAAGAAWLRVRRLAAGAWLRVPERPVRQEVRCGPGAAPGCGCRLAAGARETGAARGAVRTGCQRDRCGPVRALAVQDMGRRRRRP